MKKIFLLFPLLTITNIQFISAKNVTDSNEISIDNIKATASKLDPAVRNVLLKAIDRLERQVDNDNEQEKGNTENPNFIPTVQFYTASAEDVSQNVSPDSDIILKTILKNVASSKESNEDESKKSHFPSSNSLNSQSEQKTNNQQTRSISTDASNEISEESKTAYITPTTIRPKLSSIKFKATSTRPTTTTTTTTTTTKKPAPTHNEDGENIEVVEKKDIKIFKAPLVTAFSVQQDDKGTLKKVVPLYNEVTASSTAIEPLKPQLQPLFNGGAIIEKLKVTATNVSNIILPTPAPTQSTITVTSTTRPIPNEPTGIPIPSFLRQEVFKSNSFSLNNQPSILPFQQQQNLFSAQQTPPIVPAPAFNNPNSQSLNNFLFERQRFLEQQILQLQIQARQQQEQIILQQKLLEEQRRAKSEEQSGLKNQVNPTRNIQKSSPSFTVRPSLEILPSIAQSSKYEIYSENNHLPDKNAVNFHPTFIPINSNSINNNKNNNIINNNHLQHKTSFQIQPANQLNFIPPQTHFIPPSLPSSQLSIASPLELSTFQQLPQKSFQPFKSQQQQINSPLSISEHLQPRTRHFRQETGVGNFGTNSFFNSAEPSSNRFGEFTRQRNGFNQQQQQQQDHQSQNILFQPALNHGINPYTTTHNYQFSNPGQFGGNF